MQDIEDWGAVTVNEKCTGCMTCRVLSPDIFLETKPESKSKIFTEVACDLRSKEEFEQVRKAVMACPVAAVKWVRRPKVKNVLSVHHDYPELLEDDVYIAGLPSKKLFGGMAYLLRSPKGNILIDTPDTVPEYIEAFKAMGGIHTIIFTHKDHVAHAQEWKEIFPNVRRVMHRDDMIPFTSSFELVLEGSATQSLAGFPITLIPAPGHTPGSWFIIYKNKYLFTGDSLAYSRVLGHLVLDRFHCWQSFALQTQSLKFLRDYQFEWVLAGHGESWRFPSSEAAHQSLEECIEWATTTQDPGVTPMSSFISWTIVRTKFKSSIIRWLVDQLFLPYGTLKTIPAYSEQDRYTSLALMIGLTTASGLVMTAIGWKVAGVIKGGR